MNEISVVIAEDHYLVRAGLRRALEDSEDIQVVGTASDLDELLATARSTRPDVVLTDIRMPPGHHTEGIDAARRLREERPGLGVVIVSQYVDPEYAIELLQDGTDGIGYLLKERIGDPDHLIDAVRTVASGGSVIDGDVVATLLDDGARKDSAPLRHLTDRELDVLRCMAEGRTNDGIATALHLSRSSVEKYSTSIFSKLGLNEDGALVHKRVSAVLTLLHSEGRARPFSPVEDRGRDAPEECR